MKIQRVLKVPDLNNINKIKRSELCDISQILGYYDPNDYISQIVREYPNLEIVNDFKK